GRDREQARLLLVHLLPPASDADAGPVADAGEVAVDDASGHQRADDVADDLKDPVHPALLVPRERRFGQHRPRPPPLSTVLSADRRHPGCISRDVRPPWAAAGPADSTGSRGRKRRSTASRIPAAWRCSTAAPPSRRPPARPRR